MPSRSHRGPWILALTVVAISGLLIAYSLRATHPAPAVSATRPKEPAANDVSCLGRIEPEDGILRVAVPYLFGRPSIVKALYVKEGDRLRRGQLLAILEGREQLEAAVRQAEARIAVARRRLEQVKAGPKSGDLAAQQAEISRLAAAWENARAEYQRYEALRRTDDITVSELETKRTAMLTAQHALEAARERLKSLGEVRPSEVSLAEAELESASADAHRARAEYDSSTVYAPAAGRVLKIRTQAGEEPGPGGLLELARTDRMYAVAEVYETDILRVHVGRRATVSGEVLPTPIEGTVERIGMNVARNSVMPGDPSSFSEQRIIEVRVRLDDGQAAARLINGKVTVVIHP